jgi:acetylornithine/succinyldiaminopimelate/putrescine aminotransferase
LPIGAVLVTDDVAKVIHPGDHGTTFGGNALACTMAKHTFDRIVQPQFLADVRAKGEYLLQRLKAIKSPHVVAIRSPGGLFVGVEFDVPVNQLIQNALDRGVLFVNAGENVLRLCPALVIDREQIGKAMDVLEECISLL